MFPCGDCYKHSIHGPNRVSASIVSCFARIRPPSLPSDPTAFQRHRWAAADSGPRGGLSCRRRQGASWPQAEPS